MEFHSQVASSSVNSTIRFGNHSPWRKVVEEHNDGVGEPG